MSENIESPLREGIRIGTSMAVAFSFIAALPLGLLSIVMFVETVRGTQMEMPWSGYGWLLLLVFGSYFVIGAVAGPVFVLLRPMRSTPVGWLITGALVTTIIYGVVGVAFAEFYDEGGKYFMHDSSAAEAWAMLPPMLVIFGIIGACVGLWMWWKQSRSGADRPIRHESTPPAVLAPAGVTEQSRGRVSPGTLLTIAVIAVSVWARFESRTPAGVESRSSTIISRGLAISDGISDSTDAMARHFIRLAQRHAFDSASRMTSPTLHLQDSTMLAREIAARLPADTTLPLERVYAERWSPGEITRTMEAYALRTRSDSETVVMQTVEEMGVRWIERAGVEPGVLRTFSEVARASDSAAARLAADTTSLVRLRK